MAGIQIFDDGKKQKEGRISYLRTESVAEKGKLEQDSTVRCSSTLWYRYVVSSGSLVIIVIRLPGSSMNSTDCEHQALLVSMATGTKECVAASATYFVVLLTAAFSDAAQAVVEVSCRCDAAYISGTVTSQASGLPRVHGTRVAPSGLLPSALDSPTGFFACRNLCLLESSPNQVIEL